MRVAGGRRSAGGAVTSVAFEQTDSAVDATEGATSWTFADLEIGDAAADRITLLAVYTHMEYGGNSYVSVQVDGNDAQPVSLAFDLRRNHGDGQWSSWWAIANPTGTTATIEIVENGGNSAEGVTGCAVDVYRLTGADIRPVGADCDTYRGTAGTDDTGAELGALSAEAYVPLGGVTLAAHSAYHLATTATLTWDGATSDHSFELFSNDTRCVVAAYEPDADGLHTISIDNDASDEVTGSLALVSFAPTGGYALPSGIGRKWAKGGVISNFFNASTTDPFVLPVNLGPPAANRKVLLFVGGVMGSSTSGTASVSVDGHDGNGGHSATRLIGPINRVLFDSFSFTEIWLLDNQDLAAGFVTLTPNDLVYGFGVGAVPIYGFDTSAAADTASDMFHAAEDGAARDVSLVLDVPANGIAAACWCATSPVLPIASSWSSGLTEVGTTGIFLLNWLAWGVYEAGGSLESGHTIVAPTATVTNGTDEWEAAAVSFAPA